MKRLLVILALVCAPTYAQTNTARMLSGTNPITSCPYTIQATDTTKLLIFNSASACAVTLPAATTANFGAGAIFSVKNQGAGTVTIAPTTGTIDGAATAVLTTGQGADIYSDGVNYSTQTGKGSGAGGAPGGGNHDTQCNLGGAFSACGNNSEIRYVSSTGNDANSGLTWDTAKATVFAALEALPSGTTSPPQIGTGTVVVGDNVWWNPDHSKGLWILSTSDPNYGTPPAGWIRGVPPTFFPVNIIGRGCGTQPGSNVNNAQCFIQMNDFPGVGNGGTNNPAIWLSGGETTHIENINAGGHYGRCMALGIDSTGNRSTAGGANYSFQNMTCGGADGVDNSGKGRGPSIDLGAQVFNITFDKVFPNINLSVNEALITNTGLSVTGGILTVTFTAANTAFFTGEGCGIYGANTPAYNFSVQGTPGGSGITVVDSTHITMPTTLPNGTSGGGVFICDRGIPIVSDPGTAGGGEFIFRDAVINGGGIRMWGGALVERDVYSEGDFTHCTGPAVWFVAGGGGLGEGFIADYVSEADQCPTVNNARMALFKVEGSINPESIQITSPVENPYTEGPLTFRGDSNYALKTTPLARGEWGVVRGHLEAQTDVHRHSPQSVRYYNFTPTEPSWGTTGLTVTTGVTDNDGGTGAYTFAYASSTPSVQFMSSSGAGGTWSAGDVGICGVWLRNNGTPDLYIGTSALNIACNTAGGTTLSNSFCNTPVVYGDGEWEWYWCYFQVGTGSAATTNFSTGTLAAGTNISVYAPTMIHIPSGQVSQNDAIQMAYDMRHIPTVWPSFTGCVVGQMCDHIGAVVHTVNGVNTGLTGQPLIVSNGSLTAAPTSPGILDGNAGAAVTTTPYTIQCDSGTALVDRARLLRFQPGSSVATVPLSTASGCTGGFVVSVADDGAGNLTFNRTSPDTFSIFNGSTSTDGATSFTMTNGQYATLNQGASGIWEVRITSSTLDSSTIYATQNCSSGLSNCFQVTSGLAFFDCTYASGSPTITCTASDNLSTVQPGWRVFVTCCGASGGNAHIGSALEVAAGTTVSSVNNAAHTITMSANATTTRASVLGQSIIVGPLNDTAFANASTAALGNGGHCLPLAIGSGIYLVSQGFANSATCKNQITSNVTTGWGVHGEGPGGRSGSIILPVDNFNFATCTGVNSSCFFGVKGAIIANLAIWGGENSTNANSSTCGTNSKSIIDMNVDSLLSNVLIAGWCANDTALQAVTFEAPGEYCDYCIIDGAGGMAIRVKSGSQATIINSFGGDSNGIQPGGYAGGVCGLAIDSGGYVQSSSSGFGVCGLNTYNIGVVGTWVSFEDKCLQYSAVNNPCAYLDTGGTANINGFNNIFGIGSTSDAGIFLSSSTSKLAISNSSLTSGSGNFSINCAAGSSIVDLGGNTLGSFPTNCVSSNWSGSLSTLGAGQVAANWSVPAGSGAGQWGTSPSVTSCFGNSLVQQCTINVGSGTVGSNPVVTITFPKAFFIAPMCDAKMITGTAAIANITGFALGTTSASFTYNGTPAASSTISLKVNCSN